MKKVLTVVLSLTMIVFFAVGAYAAEMGGMKATDPMAATSTQAFKATNLIGADVKNLQGEELGKISDLAINPQGNVVFAVISRGGTLGIGAKMVPIPISALQIEPSGKVARLDITKQKLDSAPSFTSNNWQDMTNRQWTEDTYKYYGVSPYWKEGTMGMQPQSAPMHGESSGMEKPGKSGY